MFLLILTCEIGLTVMFTLLKRFAPNHLDQGRQEIQTHFAFKYG